MTLSHYKFQTILRTMAKKNGCLVFEQNEAYTSKTCTACGRLHDIGGKKTLRCACGNDIDRDINGARNILLRALADRPWLDTEKYPTCTLTSLSIV